MEISFGDCFVICVGIVLALLVDTVTPSIAVESVHVVVDECRDILRDERIPRSVRTAFLRDIDLLQMKFPKEEVQDDAH